MVGVVHATSPIDAIQRFIRRVELGMRRYRGRVDAEDVRRALSELHF